MATEPLISWNSKEHLSGQKTNDWYWSVGIITLALAVIAFLFDNVISGILVVVAGFTLVLHVSLGARDVYCEINDRGIVYDKHFYPFLSLDSFCVPHDEIPPRLLIKSNRLLTPLIVIYIDEVDPEKVREIMLKYLAEVEHRESLFKKILEWLGF
jgi:hypothetical protein